MISAVIVSLVLFVGPYGALGHSYHLGKCPAVEPVTSFQMSDMLGVWYVIQKTSTASSCLVYNFTRGDEPGEYTITQTSQHPVLGLTPLRHQYGYAGRLSVPEPSTPGRMTVKFPLSVAGDASYTVFSTDYSNYAAVFTCQKIAFSHRQSVSILSRDKSLDKMYLDKVHTRLQSLNINPYDLSIISQNDCPKNTTDGYNINIDSDTFTAQSAAHAVRKAGEKLGDGLEYIASGAKKVYHKVTDSKEEKNPDYMPPPTVVPEHRRILTSESYAEWLP